jgi:hypothetical protein
MFWQIFPRASGSARYPEVGHRSCATADLVFVLPPTDCFRVVTDKPATST